jgi:hypothetical protein
MWGAGAVLVVAVVGYMIKNVKKEDKPVGRLTPPVGQAQDTKLLNFGTKYIKTVDWPPQANLDNHSYSCSAAGQENSRAGKTTEREIAGQKYCITEETGAAAGSTYIQYAYARKEAAKALILNFSLQFPQCANYEEPNKSECERERAGFSPDMVISNWFESGKWKIAVGLKDCLPKSDMESKNKCDELLTQITDFSGCVQAGFPIMESFPRQCRTPDGRNFKENI